MYIDDSFLAITITSKSNLELKRLSSGPRSGLLSMLCILKKKLNPLVAPSLLHPTSPPEYSLSSSTESASHHYLDLTEFMT